MHSLVVLSLSRTLTLVGLGFLVCWNSRWMDAHTFFCASFLRISLSSVASSTLYLPLLLEVRTRGILFAFTGILSSAFLCVTGRLFSGVKSWMLSHRSEGFNPRKNFNPGMRFNSGIASEGFNPGMSMSGLVSNENLGMYIRTYVRTRVCSENSGERMSEQISLKWNAAMGFLCVCKWFV